MLAHTTMIQKHALQATIADSSQAIRGDDCDQLKKVLYKSAESVLGFKK